MSSERYQSRILLAIVFVGLILSFVNHSAANSSDKIYDVANVRRDFLEDQCQQDNGNSSTNEDMENFLNCTRPGLAFPYTDPIELYNTNQQELEEWCYMWPKQKDCERHNFKHIEKCLKDKSHVAVGYDLMTAFFESSCKSKGQSFPVLVDFLDRLRTQCWYRSKEIITCINALNLDNFQRNLRRITNCISAQLQWCTSSEPKELLRKILDEVEKSYSSSGFVYLLNFDDKMDFNQSHFGDGPIGHATSLCRNSLVAYIAFFSLIGIILLVAFLALALKLDIYSMVCNKKDRLITEDIPVELCDN